MDIKDQIGAFLLMLIVLFGGAACFWGLDWILDKISPPKNPSKNRPQDGGDITSPTDFMDMDI